MSTQASESQTCFQVIESSEVEAAHQDLEQQKFINHPQQLFRPRWAKMSRSSVFNKVMAVVNLAFGIILAASIGLVSHESSRSCSKSGVQSREPYSPALEAVIPIIKKFEPESKFQTESSDYLEMAWQELLGPNNGIVALDMEESTKLAQADVTTILKTSDHDKHLFGVSMYQQLYCLNIIRKAFHREEFYPDSTDGAFQRQKNECIDFLRQAIQCHGDVSMMHFSNHNDSIAKSSIHAGSYVNPDMLPVARSALGFWGVEHSCRALAPIEEWVAAHRPP